MSNPKKHHFLPVCYLNGFTNENEKIVIFDRNNLLYREQRPLSAGFEKYLYSWMLPDGSKDQSLEAVFNNIECNFPKIKLALENSELLDRYELDPLIAFVSLQLFRVPSTLKDIHTLGESVLDQRKAEILSDESSARKYIKELYGENSSEGDGSLEELIAIFEKLDSSNTRKNITLNMLLENASKSYNFLHQKNKLTVIHAPLGRSFITSDRPVLIKKSDPSALGLIGLLGNGSKVFMPLSKNIGISFSDGEESLSHVEINRVHLTQLNYLIARFSSSLLISDSYQRLESIINKTKLTTTPILTSISYSNKYYD